MLHITLQPRNFALLLAIACAPLLSGCATVLNGTRQTVEVRSAPHGANVIVDGRNVGTTPLKTDLKRGVSHVIQVEKPGYLSETKMTTTKWNAVPLLNVIIGGGIGIAVDLATGAATNVTPDAVTVDLAEQVTPPSAVSPAQYVPTSDEGHARLQ